MITLYSFGPAWGLPDASPFVTKAAMLLKMAGLPYRTESKGPREAPKGKLPYIRDGDTLIPDSTLIQFYLEQRYNADFDRGLTEEQKGIAWAAAKLCEDHLYWLIIHARWMDDANFERGPANFFKAVPAPLRRLVKSMIRRQIRASLHGQGTGRFTEGERTALAERAFASLSAILGDKPYLMGETPCGADASVFGMVGSALCPLFETPLRLKAEAHPNLRDYCARVTQAFFPETS